MLLEYIPDYRVLVCTACQYCVLPRSLNRHLKDIHHLSGKKRRALVEQAFQHDLAHINEITYSDYSIPAIPGLPIYNGYACKDQCRHLCITKKRMQLHWLRSHKDSVSTNFRKVKLQTLFRGRQLQYFQVHTPKPTLTPIQEEPTQTFTSWLLLTHFFTTAHPHLKPCRATSPSWLPQLHSSPPFLHYLLLSVTASHIAFTHPPTRPHYLSEATSYRTAAIHDLTLSISKVDPVNFFAVFNFSRLMTVAYIAAARLDLFNGNGEEGLLPEWFTVQLQGRALVWHFRGKGRIADAMCGPYAALRLVDFMPEEYMAGNPFDGVLGEVEEGVRGRCGDGVDGDVMDALSVLRRIWAIPYSNDAVGFRDVALMFAVRVPRRYLDLIREGHQAALVVYAYFWAMWSLAEAEYWYMHGHAEIMLDRIGKYLKEDWRELIEWPKAIVSGAPSHSDLLLAM